MPASAFLLPPSMCMMVSVTLSSTTRSLVRISMEVYTVMHAYSDNTLARVECTCIRKQVHSHLHRNTKTHAHILFLKKMKV